MSKRMKQWLLAGIMILLGACEAEQVPEASTPAPTDTPVTQNVMTRPAPDAVTRGAQVYKTFCLECHGEGGRGAENWTRRDAQGKWPPPPLNGTAHAWHHPRAQLAQIIREGTAQTGGNMPAWSSVLSEQEIQDVISYFQSLWPDEIYRAWHENFQGK